MRRTAFEAALVVPVYVLLAKAGFWLGAFDDLSVWYAPTGLALAAATAHGWKVWPLLAIGEYLTGSLIFGIGPDFGIPLMILNALAYSAVWCLGGMAIRRLGLRIPLRELVKGGQVALVAVLAAPLASSLVGNGMRVLAGTDPATDLPANIWVWYLGDAIGVLTLGPAVLVIAMLFGLSQPARTPPMLRDTPGVLLLASVVAPTAVAMVIFQWAPQATGSLVVIAVPMSFVAVRFGLAGVAIASALLSPVMTGLANVRAGSLLIERTDLQVLLLGIMIAALVIAVPVEHRRVLLDRLRRSEDHLAHAQRQAQLGSFRWGSDDSVEWSEGLVAIFGKRLEPEPGATMFDTYLALVEEDHRADVAETLGAVVYGKVDRIDHEYPIRVASGQVRWLESRLERQVDAHGQLVAVLGTCLDVTSRRRAVEATANAHHAELAAARRVQHAEDVKDALLTAVSHEIRTPLTLLVGAAELLERPEVSGSPTILRPLLSRLRPNVTRLHAVLADLLDTHRLGRGVIDARRRPTDLATLVDGVLARAPAPGREIIVDLGSETAVIDRGLVDRILWSLLTNGARYTPPETRLWVRIESQGDGLVLSVDDEGPGVANEDKERIFRRFEQVTRIDHSPGTGLGLHLVQQFAELHGGRAWVEDRPGGGASFRVQLPGATSVVS